MSPQTTPNFCSQCGASLSPGDAFCPQCGSAVSDDAGVSTERTRATAGRERPTGARTAERSDLRRRVEDLTVEGWDVKHDYGDRVVMVDRGVGSVAVHALLLATTSGVGNLLYAWYSYSPGAERRELRADGTERRSSDDREGDRSEWSLGSAVGVAAGLTVAVVLAFVGLVVTWAASSLVPTGIGLALWLAGVAAVPLATQFAPGFESPTTFGRRKTTDETVVEAPDTPCSACARPVGTGVRRTFAEKRYVAGIPVGTYDEGQNEYCRACANGDPFGREPDESYWDREQERDREFA